MDRDRRNLLIGGGIFGTVAISGLLPSACMMRRDVPTNAIATGAMPMRPEGEAKPLLEEDIGPVLARLDAWYSVNLTSPEYKFNPPATDAQIDTFERLIGLKLPNAYRQLYRWHDGENDDRWGHFYGLPLLPLERVTRNWQNWQKILVQFGGNRYFIPGEGWPRGAVDPAYINPAWIALTDDGSGNHIGIDLDPWPGGRVGQIILFGRDEDVKIVMAESLGQFLEWLADLLESGNFRLGPSEDEGMLRQFRLKQPPSNHFHEGARILLNAPGQFL